LFYGFVTRRSHQPVPRRKAATLLSATLCPMVKFPKFYGEAENNRFPPWWPLPVPPYHTFR